MPVLDPRTTYADLRPGDYMYTLDPERRATLILKIEPDETRRYEQCVLIHYIAVDGDGNIKVFEESFTGEAIDMSRQCSRDGWTIFRPI